MVQIITIILGFIFSIMCFLLIISFYKKTNRINLLIFFLFALIIFNGVIPSFLIFEAENSSHFSYSLNIINGYTWYDVLLYYSQNIILLFSAVIGWMLIKKSDHKLYSKNNSQTIFSSYRLMKNIAMLLLIFSIITYYLYSTAYGGFIGLLEHTGSIRSGFTINSPFSFMQKFGAFGIFSTLLFSGLIVEKNYKKRDLFWFFISVSFSIYYLYSLGGRVGFVAFFVTLLFGFIFYKYQDKIKIGLVMRIGLIIIGIISGLYLSTNLFSRGTESLPIVGFFIQELSFPFASFLEVSEYPGIFLFKHVIFAPLYFLPSSIWSSQLGLDTASSFNTLLFTGAVKGENGVTGSVPLDMVSFSWLEGGIVGTLIVGILYGLLLAILQKMVNLIPNRGVRSFIFSYAAIQFSLLIVNYGDSVHIIQGEFAFIISILILSFCVKRISYRKYN